MTFLDSSLPDLIIDFYKNLFTSSQEYMDKILVYEDQNDFLLESYIREEVKDALFSMHPNKSPGSDGLNMRFF